MPMRSAPLPGPCTLALLILLALAAGPALGAEEDPAETGRALFDGRSLAGWVRHGGEARYAVEEGAIVGTAVADTSNSFLCTAERYGDFALELEFRVDPGLNSGVQIRSEVFPEERTVTWVGPEGERERKRIRAGRVHGYQVEIDPSERAWSGGLYDEARRGWLDDLEDRPEARRAFRPGAWNRLRIEARGERMRTWINGVPAADQRDGMTPRGLICLQVHEVEDEDAGLQVRWRGLRLRELSGAPESD